MFVQVPTGTSGRPYSISGIAINSATGCQRFSQKWEPRVGARVAEVRIKRMKTRWGTCNGGARRIWLNLELAKKPASCLEYIVVHEMVHLIERSHNDRFQDLMGRLMPQWRVRRDELNRAPLAHADWHY